jgi:hypothetical protein
MEKQSNAWAGHRNIDRQLISEEDAFLWLSKGDIKVETESEIVEPVETSQGGKVTKLWNQQVQTDRTIPNKKPDIIIRGNEKGTRMLIDVAISGDRNVIKKEAEEILKYKDLAIEIQRMWNAKTKVIPVIIGATGTISKSFRKYMSNIPGKHEVKELQKTTILGTAHILRKVLMLKYNRFNSETNDISTVNSNNRVAAILFSVGT